jgi:hypothetical protein
MQPWKNCKLASRIWTTFNRSNNCKLIFGYYQDYGEWQKVLDLFTDNEPSVEEFDRGVYKGKESVRRYYIDLWTGR